MRITARKSVKTLLFLAAACMHLTAFAQVAPSTAGSGLAPVALDSSPLDAFGNINNVLQIRRAKMVILPWSVIVEVIVDEEYLNKHACVFSTESPLHLEHLIRLLQQLNVNTEKKPSAGTPRQAIYLTLADGTEVKFLLSNRYTNKKIYGIVSQPGLPGFVDKYLIGDARFVVDLYKLAADIGTLKAISPYGQSMHSTCDYFFSADNPALR